MDDFRRHRGWCPRGAPADGRLRLDLFPDYAAGDVMPWCAGVGARRRLRISDGLSEGLRAWNVARERRLAEHGSADVPSWRDPWRRDVEALAARLASETGDEVVLLWPELDARDETCPNRATQPWERPGWDDGVGA